MKNNLYFLLEHGQKFPLHRKNIEVSELLIYAHFNANSKQSHFNIFVFIDTQLKQFKVQTVYLLNYKVGRYL